MEKNRSGAFKEALETVSQKYKTFELDTMLDMKSKVDVDLVSTGSLVIDSIIGGGAPKGRVIEIYGPEASGKTSIALTMGANIQKEGGNVVFLDVEQAFDPIYASKLGIDINKLGFCQPIIAEECINLILDLCDTDAVDMIIVDSVAAMVPRAEYGGDIEKATVGLMARIMSKGLRQIAYKANKNKCTVVFLNQTRDNIGVMYGPKTGTTGGKALKFYTSLRLEVKKDKKVEEDGDVIGTSVKIKCVKNKIAPPYGEASTVLTFAKGINRAAEILVLGEQFGIITKEGRTYYCDCPDNFKVEEGKGYTAEIVTDKKNKKRIKIGNSKKNATIEMEKNQPLYDIIAEKVIFEVKKRNNLVETVIEEETPESEMLGVDEDMFGFEEEE